MRQIQKSKELEDLENKRNKISFSLKFVTAAAALVGVVWSFFSASADGYSHWSKRLLYFTSQSNLWIGLTFALILVLGRAGRLSEDTRVKNLLYILKYIFTVSITLTGFIFCAVLAPGAANANYNAWSAASILTHVVVPALSVVDFFVDTYRVPLTRRHSLLSVTPPLLYSVFASVLCVMKVDFGRGEPFPYFFFNYYSPAGVFGTSEVMPYRIGSFYWIVFILLVILGVSALYRRLYNKDK